MNRREMESFEEEQPAKRSLKESWNAFISALITAKDIWEKELIGTSREVIEVEGEGINKAFSVYRLSKFDIMLSRFIDYWRMSGGLEGMIVETIKEGD